MKWTVVVFNNAVRKELDSLPADIRANFELLVELIENFGLDDLPPKAVKHLEGKLWELRITGRDGIARAITITASPRKLTILRVFIKKTQKTPRNELETARRRAKLLN